MYKMAFPTKCLFASFTANIKQAGPGHLIKSVARYTNNWSSKLFD